MLTFFDTFLQISTRGRINNIECIPIPINERKLLMEGKDTKWRWLLAITTSIRGFTHRPLSSSGSCERFELMIEKNHERLPLIPSQSFRSSTAERFKTLTKPLATKITENYRKNMPLATPSKSFHDQVQTQNFLNIIFIHTCYELIIFSCLHMLSFLSEHICLFCLFHISEPVRTRRNSYLNVLLPHSRQADDYRP